MASFSKQSLDVSQFHRLHQTLGHLGITCINQYWNNDCVVECMGNVSGGLNIPYTYICPCTVVGGQTDGQAVGPNVTMRTYLTIEILTYGNVPWTK